MFQAICFEQQKCVCVHTKGLHTVLMLEPGATYISVQVCTVAFVLAFDLSFDFTCKPTGSRYWCPYTAVIVCKMLPLRFVVGLIATACFQILYVLTSRDRRPVSFNITQVVQRSLQLEAHVKHRLSSAFSANCVCRLRQYFEGFFFLIFLK